MDNEEKVNNLEQYQSLCSIKVVGVGGAGNNAIDHMLEQDIEGAEFWVANTDVQMLSKSKAKNRIILGEEITKGLGAGANPEIGKQAAQESEDKIREALEGAEMVFIAAGMGGGTGTGGAPVFAKIAKELGALTIGVATKPFTFEGPARTKHANKGVQELREHVDSLIIVSNDRLLQLSGNLPLKDSFRKADQVLSQSVSTIVDLISKTGFINRDFADVRTVMYEKGIAMIGFGEASGDGKIKEATNLAISSPLLEASFHGAKNAIVNITGSSELSLYDVNDVTEMITEASGGDINIILGASHSDELEDEVKISVIATDFDEEALKKVVENQRPEEKVEQTSIEIDDDLDGDEEDDEQDDMIPEFLK